MTTLLHKEILRKSNFSELLIHNVESNCTGPYARIIYEENDEDDNYYPLYAICPLCGENTEILNCDNDYHGVLNCCVAYINYEEYEDFDDVDDFKSKLMPYIDKNGNEYQSIICKLNKIIYLEDEKLKCIVGDKSIYDEHGFCIYDYTREIYGEGDKYTNGKHNDADSLINKWFLKVDSYSAKFAVHSLIENYKDRRSVGAIEHIYEYDIFRYFILEGGYVVEYFE